MVKIEVLEHRLQVRILISFFVLCTALWLIWIRKTCLSLVLSAFNFMKPEIEDFSRLCNAPFHALICAYSYVQ